MTGIAFVGDLHASRAIYGSHPMMRGDTQFAFRQITEYCNEHDLSLCLLGDNFDKRYPEPDVVAWFVHYAKNIPMAYIVGQHDHHITDQWPDLCQSVSIDRESADGNCINFGGFDLWGFNNSPRHVVEERLKKVPDECEILCVHQLFPQVMGLEGAWTMDPMWVKPAADGGPAMIMAGDFHGLPQDGHVEDRDWFYTGSMTMRSVSEPREKSFSVMQRGEGGSPMVQRIDLKTRPFLYQEVIGEAELDKLLHTLVADIERAVNLARAEGVPDEVAAPFLVLRYSTDILSLHSKVMDVIGSLVQANQVHYHPMPRAVTEVEAAAISDKVVSLQDAIAERVDRETAPELHALVSELAVAPNPRETVLAFKEQHGVADDPTKK